ncbi:MAG: hypothetical protein H8E44_14545 [Planctomycetes bacterium]|nr:hypothetical protein [Planctomycetota bacterium]MBL7043731.1 hypothetical protein [Pirellulaceae bacterium]
MSGIALVGQIGQSTGGPRGWAVVTLMLVAALLVGLFSMPLTPCAWAGADQLAPDGLDRWAVVCSADVRKTGIGDLLTARLSEVAGIKLVERERLDEALREFELGLLSRDEKASDRVRLGRLLGADALLLLSRVRGEKQEFVQVAVSDCRHGARLRTEHFPCSEDARALAEKIVQMVGEIREHFASGVSTIVGVSPFVSKSLVHDYDRLQAGFAHLLQDALASAPGVAVIEVEEARAIRRELSLGSDGRVERVVPVLVEADFAASRSAPDKEVRIAFEIRILQASDTPKVVRSSTLALSQTPRYLTTDVPGLVLEEVTAKKQRPLSAQQQASWLIDRADTFARLGTWEHAIGLREAALLLKPDDTDLRLQLVGEYRRQATRRIGEAAELGDWKLDHPLIRAAIQGRVDAYRAGLSHLEYLIRNRRIPAMRAVELADRYRSHCFLYSIPFVTGTVNGEYRRVGQIELEQAEEAQRRFLFEVLPQVPALPDDDVPKHRFGKAHLLHAWQRVVAEIALLQVDRTYRTKQDLDLVFRVLTQVVPDGLETQLHVEQFLSYQGRRYQTRLEGVGAFTDEDWLAFLKDLENSKHSVVSLYGRYGQIRYQWAERDQLSTSQLRELHDTLDRFLQDFAATKYDPIWNYGRTREWMYGRAKDVRTYASRELERRTRAPKTDIARKPSTSHKPRDLRSLGRLRFDRLDLRVRDVSGQISSAKGKRWRSPYGWGGISHVIRCGQDLDVYWQNGAVLFMREEGILDEVFVDREPNFEQVAWDGQSVWIATRWLGIWVVDPDGTVLSRVNADDGLPPTSHGVIIQPVSEGRVVAIGSFGEHQRAWCATIDCRNPSRPAVRVFHEATRVVQPDEAREDVEDDPSLCFKPHWVHAHRASGPSAGPLLLVGRYSPTHAGRRRPLLINLRTLEVKVFGSDLAMADHRYSDSYFSSEGLLLETGDNGVTLRPEPGTALPDGKQSRQLCLDRADRNIVGHQGGFAKKLLPYEGWLYAPGGTWWRIHPQTFEAERLVPWRLPLHLEGLRKFGVSAHYGLIAWGSEFYRVRVVDAEESTDE